MAEQLTKEQILLLNNLMYVVDGEPFESITTSDAETVGKYINQIPVDEIKDNEDYGSYMTGADWKRLISAVKSDEQLMGMEIAATHVDNAQNGGGGKSAVFVAPQTNEAVVAFRGTSEREWKDNFTGGGPTDAADGVSTLQQENALDWYQSLNLEQYDTITVTGHSKGGNKAKYITVMDDSVDRCMAFDGQGFSDEFMIKYQDRIARNQDKITNSNVDKDYVNLLLNDIGHTIFYEGYDYGDGGFLENHCPNTFCDFQSDGTFKMREGTRDEGMAALDEMLNSYLRTLSPEDKKATLEMIGKLVESGFSGADANRMLEILLDENNTEYAANLLAYLVKYKEENPELMEAVRDVLDDMELGDVADNIDSILNIIDWEYFDKIIDALGWVSGHVPGFVYDWIQDYLEKQGIHLSEEDLKKLLNILQLISEDIDKVQTNRNGADMVISFKSGSYGVFDICIGKVKGKESELEQCSTLLRSYARQIRNIRKNLVDGMKGIGKVLEDIETELLQEAEGCERMRKVLAEVCQCYSNSERKIAAMSKIAV